MVTGQFTNKPLAVGQAADFCYCRLVNSPKCVVENLDYMIALSELS